MLSSVTDKEYATRVVRPTIDPTHTRAPMRLLPRPEGELAISPAAQYMPPCAPTTPYHHGNCINHTFYRDAVCSSTLAKLQCARSLRQHDWPRPQPSPHQSPRPQAYNTFTKIVHVQCGNNPYTNTSCQGITRLPARKKKKCSRHTPSTTISNIKTPLLVSMLLNTTANVRSPLSKE